jgi:hypothetical protein
MKKALYKDREQELLWRRIGRKTRSHGTHRAKRKPNSKMVNGMSGNAQYRSV